ncbi:MAG: zinc ABC transporter substrate-binding protein [Kiloniellaceae bacterium]
MTETMVWRTRAARRVRRSSLAATGLLLVLAAAGRPGAAAPKVVASLKPVHSLVAGVMAGVGEPYLLVQGGATPHAYSLRPSAARALSAADLVVWVGPALEGFLVKPLDALAGRARILTLIREPGMTLRAIRLSGLWEHEAHAAAEGEGDAGARARGAVDPHVWLDPANARRIVEASAAALAELDPGNGAAYRANAARLGARLDALDAALRARLAPVKDAPFVVFHDAYQYFERRFALNAVGAFALSPERPPGVRRLARIRARILDLGVACVFAEPQFEPALVRAVSAGAPVRIAALDPLGAALAPGPEAYFRLMEALADNLVACLRPG